MLTTLSHTPSRSTGSTFATDMFAFGRTIEEVKSACDPSDGDVGDVVNGGGDAMSAGAIVARLCDHSVGKRMCAADAVEHAFFAPARYLYTYIHICIYIYTYTHTYICIHTYLHHAVEHAFFAPARYIYIHTYNTHVHIQGEPNRGC
jgi:hypothetical protein